MTVTVLVQQTNGEFRASLVGASAIQVANSTRAEAILALHRELAAKVAAGELVDLELNPLGVSGLTGLFQHDPTLQGICDEIYRLRDAERPE